MSQETAQWLNTMTLIGYTEKRGQAWHYREADQGDEPNHYTGPIPVEDVSRRLFYWTPAEGTFEGTYLTPDGVDRITSPDEKTIIRPRGTFGADDPGKILGKFKGQPGGDDGYRIHGYQEWLVEYVANLLDADLAIGSAGLLKGGAVAWVQVELADTMTTSVGGVKFRPFVTAATSLDGSLSTTYVTGAQVVVCDNTLSVGLSNADGKVKIKHSRYSTARVADVRAALEIVHTTGDAFDAQVKMLLDEHVDDATWARFVSAYVGDKPGVERSKRSQGMAIRKADELNLLWNYDPRVAPWRGNAYGVLAAVNTHVHHVQTVRGTGRVERNMERAVTGGVDKLDASTLELLASVR
jgi:phage/plasmid-like protein (TIGR03299 family)